MTVKSFGGGGGGVATRVIQAHDETISGGATWHYPLEDDAGVESVTGGSPVDLTGTNKFHPQDPAGQGGSLDGDRSAAITGSIGAGVRLLDAVTVAIWIRRTAANGSNVTLFGARKSGSTAGDNTPWELSLDTANKVRIVWHYGTHTAETSTATGATALDTWEHWCFTRPVAGTSCKLFKNGLLEDTEFTGLTKPADGSNNNTISVGQQGSGGAKFDGDLFSAILYPEELSPTQVLALYNSTSSTGDWD